MKKDKTDKKNAGGVTAATPKAKSETTLKGFAGLGVAAAKLKLSVPTLASLKSLDGLGDTIQGKREAAGKIRGDVADAAKFILASNRQLAACTDHDERRFLEEELNETGKAANEYLVQVLELKGVLKTVAAMAYLKTVLTMEYASPLEVNTMLGELVKKGILIGGSGQQGSPITIGYLHYRISDKLGLDATDIDEISGVVEQLSRAVKTMERERRDTMTEEMKAQANISLEDALAGKVGKCLVYVPPEAYRDSKDVEKWRGGGNVMFDFGKNEVAAIQASGSVERLIADIAARKVVLYRSHLTWKTTPPFRVLVESIAKNLELSRFQAESYAGDIMTLWHMLRRGIAHDKEVKAQAKAKEEMLVKAEITAMEFFGLNGAGGKPVQNKTAFLQFDGVFHLRDTKLFNPFLLATRGMDADKEFLEVVEVPSHLREHLGNYVGKKFLTNDRRAFPELSDLISKIRAQQEMAATVAAKH